MALSEEGLTGKVIGAAITVHRHLGPGLLESVYEDCLCDELTRNGLSFERQKVLPLVYRGRQLGDGFRLDLVVESKLILELKACTRLEPIHEAQLLTYLKLSGLKIGLVINFNSCVIKDGIKRLVLKA